MSQQTPTSQSPSSSAKTTRADEQPGRRQAEISAKRVAALQMAFEAAIEGEIRFDKVSRALYSTDASVYQIMPVCVVIPRSRDDVIETVRLCRQHNVSITARGGGTSQAGQAVGTGVQLDFSKFMNRIVEINPDQKTVCVEPGIVLDELNAILNRYGLHLPLDLSTSNRATIGGMIANNSSGTRSVVYGKTLDYVLELTVVLADGSVVRLQPLDPNELAAKCDQADLQATCYRVVRRLASEHADEIARRFRIHGGLLISSGQAGHAASGMYSHYAGGMR